MEDQSMTVEQIDPIEESVFLARVAEQAECYSEMLEFLEPLMRSKDSKMTHEDRVLITVALKNVIKPTQKLWRTLTAAEKFEKFNKYKKYIDEYKSNVQLRFEKECIHTIETIDSTVIQWAEDNNHKDTLAYFLKVKGDFYRYICEIQTGDSLAKAKAQALQAYQKASEIKLHPGSPIRLSIAVGHSVYLGDVEGQIAEAIKISERALSDAQDKIEEMVDEEFKEAKTLVDLLKDNVELWKQQLDEIKHKEEMEAKNESQNQSEQ